MSNESFRRWLASTSVVDWETPSIRDQAARLAKGRTGDQAITRSCFEWVRDEIPHTGDHALDPITCAASDVLAHRTGFCYAKSHLLAALLRANGIPAGFVYQRLNLGDGTFCLHGLNAVRLDGIGWYRLDARGARADLQSEFSPPEERLPFAASEPGERLFAGIWAEPVPLVAETLRRHPTREGVLAHLPDAEDLGTPDVSL
jgi:transglutaminase-like putative cysteine protease